MKWSVFIRIIVSITSIMFLVLAILFQEFTEIFIISAILPIIVKELIHPYISRLEQGEKKNAERKKIIFKLYKIVVDIKQGIINIVDKAESANWRAIKILVTRIGDYEKEFREFLGIQETSDIAQRVNFVLLDGRYTMWGDFTSKDWGLTNHEKHIRLSKNPDEFFGFLDKILEEIRNRIKKRFGFKIAKN